MQTSHTNIHTLVPDIYELVSRKDGWFEEAMASDMGREIALKMRIRFEPSERRGLRLSGLGPKCPCSLWHSINKPHLADPMQPRAHVTFMYGDLIESMAIALAKAAGHEVTGEQDALSVDGIVGHRDCIIDGCLVDVKSTTSWGFDAFKERRVESDIFLAGYLEQLDAYLVGSLDDPLVRTKDRAYILAIDKTKGNMVLYEHVLREAHIKKRIKHLKELVLLPSPPKCECGVIPDGKSGNLRLDTKASYNSFRHCCFPNLRTFIYSDGPRYLTKVVREPDVPEIKRSNSTTY